MILLIFKIEGNIPEAKGWLNKNASWSDMPLYNNLKILVGKLFFPSLLPSFKEGIMLETSLLSVEVIKKVQYLRVGGNQNIFYRQI